MSIKILLIKLLLKHLHILYYFAHETYVQLINNLLS